MKKSHHILYQISLITILFLIAATIGKSVLDQKANRIYKKPAGCRLMEEEVEELANGYVIKSHLSEEINDTDQLLMYVAMQQVEVIIDGKVVYKPKSMDNYHLWKVDSAKTIRVPLSAGMASKPVEITVTSPYEKYRQAHRPIYFGSKTMTERAVFSDDIIVFLVSTLAISACLVLLLAYGISSRFFHVHNLKVLFLTIIMLLISVWMFSVCKMSAALFEDTYFLYGLRFLSFMLLPYVMQHYMDFLMGRKYHGLFFVYEAVTFIDVVAVVMIQLFGIKDFLETIQISSAILVVTMLTFGVLSVVKIREKWDRSYVTMLCAQICLIPIVSYEIFMPGLRSGNERWFGGFLVSMGFMLFVAFFFYDGSRNILSIRLERERAFQDSRNKSVFLANMSHEIRTPMNAIVTLSSLLRESKNLTIGEKEYVNTIYSSSQHLLAIINDILDFTKFSTGAYDMVEDEYELEKLVKEVRDLIAIRAEEKGLEFQIFWEMEPYVKLWGCEERVRQILINLLNNAIKYTNTGSVSLLIMKKDEEDHTQLTFQVKDTGIGIKEADLNKLFQEFTQVDEKANRGQEGTGLGLAICKTLTEAMNGSVTAESEYGKGSCFTATIEQKLLQPKKKIPQSDGKKAWVYCNHSEKWYYVKMLDRLGFTYEQEPVFSEETDCDDVYVFLDMKDYENNYRNIFSSLNDNRTYIGIAPIEYLNTNENLQMLRKPPLPFEVLDIMSGAVKGNHVEERFFAPDARILVVDDNQVNLTVIKELLERYGIQVTLMRYARNAIDSMKLGEKYDIILMDYMMPEIDGLEATKIIRKIPGCSIDELPIVALTADVLNGTKEMMFSGGMNGYLTKPIDFRELDAILRTYIPKEKQTSKAKEKRQEVMTYLFHAEDPVDEELGLSRCMNSPSTYRLVVETFLEDGEQIARQLERAFIAEDVNEYKIHAHGLKSAAGSIGAEIVREKALELEQYAKAGEWLQIKEHHHELMELLSQMVELIEKRL